MGWPIEVRQLGNVGGLDGGSAKTEDSGVLNFVHATGIFAGENFDYDTVGRINWASGAVTSLNIIGPTHCTLGGEYRFRSVVSGDSVLTPISYSCELTDLSTVYQRL